MNKYSFAFGLLLSLSACQFGDGAGTAAPLAGAKMGGSFSLTDQNGRTVTEKDFAGRYYIAYFGYSFCPDICPTDALAIGAGLKQFEKTDPARARKVIPVFITADPKRDTPAILKLFLANFHPRFVGLTGSEEQIDAVSQKYGVTIMRNKPDAKGGYLVDHGRYAALYGPDGQPLAFVGQEDGAAAVAASLDRWVK
jgi:protein SCO1